MLLSRGNPKGRSEGRLTPSSVPSTTVHSPLGTTQVSSTGVSQSTPDPSRDGVMPSAVVPSIQPRSRHSSSGGPVTSGEPSGPVASGSVVVTRSPSADSSTGVAPNSCAGICHASSGLERGALRCRDCHQSDARITSQSRSSDADSPVARSWVTRAFSPWTYAVSSTTPSIPTGASS